MNVIQNLAAFCIPIILFVYWNILGFATLSLLRPQRNYLQNLLISPAVGMSICLLPLFCLSRAGLPIKDIAIPLTFCLLLISITILLVKKTVPPLRQYRLFALVFLLALFLTGRPLLYLGFNWISFANDDMANYCGTALRFLNHGYFDRPSVDQFLHGKDYSQYFWFFSVPSMIRGGSDLLLAWVSGVAKLSPVQLFMPLILAFYLGLVSAVGGMVLSNNHRYKISVITCLLVAFSALTSLGVFYQLIAQIIGLTLFIATSIFLFETIQRTNKFYIKQAILISITTCALLITYPEVMPILAISFLVYLTLSIFSTGWKSFLESLKPLILAGIFSLLFLNVYWLNILSFMHFQATVGLESTKGDLFPYFLIPSGIANLWGLIPLVPLPKGYWLPVLILLGLTFSLIALVMVFKQTLKRYSPAVILLVMVVLAFFMVIRMHQHSGFTLFKLAMYVQPFLMTVVVISIFEMVPIKSIRVGLLVFFIAANFFTQYNYFSDSFGDLGKSFCELSGASRSHVLSELNRISKTISPDSTIVSDTPNLVSAKLEALYLGEDNLLFYSDAFFNRTISVGDNIFQKFYPEDHSIALDIKNKMVTSKPKLSFTFENASNLALSSWFFAPHSYSADSFLLMDSPIHSILNRYYLSQTKNRNYVIKPIYDISNHLVFVNSSLGQYYYFGDQDFVTLNNLEQDYFYPKETMAGLGRYLLFQVINPTKKIRLELNITETLRSDGVNKLPRPVIIGDKSYSLPLAGRGSARVFSPEFSVRNLDNNNYFMLDMGEDGKKFPTSHHGIMKLYGGNIDLDKRLLVGFVRDISVISDEEYKNLKAPSVLSKFPSDLNNENLEYSGIYEDGWIAEDAFFKLKQPSSKSQLIISGLISKMDKQFKIPTLTVSIDGKKIFAKTLEAGYFKLKIPVDGGSGNREIKLHFSETQKLPPGDDRPVSAQLSLIGFVDG